SFVTRDLSTVLPRIKIAAALALPLEDVLNKVREVADWTGSRPIVAAFGPGNALPYAPNAGADPYEGFKPLIVPENITLLAKTAAQTTGGNPSGERVVVVKKGDTITSILREAGATPEEIKAVVALLGPRGRDNGLKEGQKVRLLVAPPLPANPPQHPTHL